MSVNATKTWEYIINEVVSGSDITDRNEKLWLKLKQMLTDTGGLSPVDENSSAISLSAPAIVIASSNGSVADSADNWNAQTDIVSDAAGNAHSWIQLRFVDYFGVGDHLNLLLACEDVANGSVGYVAWTRHATGWNNDGTTTNRPTAAGGVVLVTRDGLGPTGNVKDSDIMWGSDSVNNQAVLQFRITDDGQAGSWKVLIAGATVAWQGWQRDEEGPGSVDHTQDYWVWAASIDSNAEMMTWSAALNSNDIFRSVDNGLSEINAYATAAVIGGSETPIHLNNASTQRWTEQIMLARLADSTVYGLLTDTWWGSSVEGTGDRSPTTPPATRAQFGHLVEPWPSGSPIVIT